MKLLERSPFRSQGTEEQHGLTWNQLRSKVETNRGDNGPPWIRVVASTLRGPDITSTATHLQVVKRRSSSACRRMEKNGANLLSSRRSRLIVWMAGLLLSERSLP